MNVVYAPRALRDLDSIAAYLTERNPAGAINVLGAIKSSIDTLNFFPQIGRLVDNAEHRRVPVLRYPSSSTIASQGTNF
jgi:plasmid stabilization system protein ParE